MEIRIVNAEKSDLKDCHHCLNSLAEYENMSDSFTLTEEKLGEILFEEKILNALIAKNESETVGLLTYYFSVSTFSGKKILYIEDIFTFEKFRGQGIGKQFFDKAREMAKENDCCWIEWKCLDWNKNSIEFYKKQGGRPVEEWITFSISEHNF